MSTEPRPKTTRWDVLAIIGISMLALIVAVVSKIRSRAPGAEFRTVCAANLKGIGTGMYTYANENADMWPIAIHPPALDVEIGRVAYAPGNIGAKRGDGKDPSSGETTDKDTSMSTTRNLWVLVRTGAATPKSFVCPTSSDEPNNEDNPQIFWDFEKYSQVSYGYQVPYGKKGLPSNNCDQRMPLAADKGPYGAAVEAGAKNPGVPTPRLTPGWQDWQPWNSPNHGGEGQVVLFADCHVEFLTTPIVGIKNDNIYTRWSRADGGSDADPAPRIHGAPPTSNETPWSDTDSFIYP